jgi:hypothetical protein
MTWVFSLPPPIDASRRISTIVEYARLEYKFVFVVNFYSVFDSTAEFELWCQRHFCYYFYDRVSWDPWMKRWCSNGIGGTDHVFIVTNSSQSALLAQFKWVN